MLQAHSVKLRGEIRLIAENRLSQISFGPISVEKPRSGGIEARRRHFVLPVIVAKSQGVP
jgi:hypothetical protein